MSHLFSLEKVQLNFTVSGVTSLAVASNILCIGTEKGLILRIDLEQPQFVDEIEISPKSPDKARVKRLFMDPTGSHVIVSTSSGENYYIHSGSTKAKQLNRLKSTFVTSVGWNPALPTRNTGAILLGTTSGAVLESFLEPSDEFFRRGDRYLKPVHNLPARTFVHNLVPLDLDDCFKGLLMANRGQIHLCRLEDDKSFTFANYTKFFGDCTIHTENYQVGSSGPTDPLEIVRPTPLVVGPQDHRKRRAFSWLTEFGVLHGMLCSDPNEPDWTFPIQNARLILNDELETPEASTPVIGVELTYYHILVLRGDAIYAINRIDNRVVFQQRIVTSPGEKLIGLAADNTRGTFWVYTSINIYEIVASDESKDIWRSLLELGDYEEALLLASDEESKDTVLTKYGSYLLEKGDYKKAAKTLGSSSVPLEQTALKFMEQKEMDSLLCYLRTKLKSYAKDQETIVQRVLLTTWVVEIVVEQLNEMEDLNKAYSSQCLVEHDLGAHENSAVYDDAKRLESKREQYERLFESFISEFQHDMDKDTIYEVLSSHGRRQQLLTFAETIGDTSFILSLHVNTKAWGDAIKILGQQVDESLIYKYSTVLLVNYPRATVDLWMRFPDLKVSSLIPAILSYVRHPVLGENHAVRYLNYVINELRCTDMSVHNTLISIYASDTAAFDEQLLLRYLHEHGSSPHFDSEFALRICRKYDRLATCVRILTSQGLYVEAIELALKLEDGIELALSIADKPEDDPALCKELWLTAARLLLENKVAENNMQAVSQAVTLLLRGEQGGLQDLLDMLPDFTNLADIKEQVLASMDRYNRLLEDANREMDVALRVTERGRDELKRLDQRYAILEPGEGCALCKYPAVTRKFYVFPCQHVYHSDCLLEYVQKHAPFKLRKQIEILGSQTVQKEALQEILSSECPLCNSMHIYTVDQPLVTATDLEKWHL